MKRERLHKLITEKAVSFGIAQVEVNLIDRTNILSATLLAMGQALEQLDPEPEIVLVDGRELPQVPVRQRAIIGGDRTCASIAAASILAKVARDRIMVELDARYPDYGFAQHKGYSTRQHLAKLKELGPCPEHRRSFAPVRAALHPPLFP